MRLKVQWEGNSSAILDLDGSSPLGHVYGYAILFKVCACLSLCFTAVSKIFRGVVSLIIASKENSIEYVERRGKKWHPSLSDLENISEWNKSWDMAERRGDLHKKKGIEG